MPLALLGSKQIFHNRNSSFVSARVVSVLVVVLTFNTHTPYRFLNPDTMPPRQRKKAKKKPPELSVGESLAALQADSERMKREGKAAKLKKEALTAQLKEQKIQSVRMDLVHEKVAEKKEVEKVRKRTIAGVLRGEAPELDDAASEDECEMFLGIPVDDLQRVDIYPTDLAPPKSGKSWVWKHCTLVRPRLPSAEVEDARREALEEPLPPLLSPAPHHHKGQWFCGPCFRAGKPCWRKWSSPGN
jgi:hypothetical protein